jgi:hypothetical protein
VGGRCTDRRPHDRGEVYFEHSSALPWSSDTYFETWAFAPAWSYAIGADAVPLIDKKPIESDLHGRIAERAFPGAEHVELLGDQCTLLYGAGNPGMQTAFVPLHADDLVVVGEWRAAAQPMVRRRAAR